MKDLVESYLAAIDAQLPAESRADVIAELRDTLLTRIEEKEAALGRPAAREDVEAILAAFGHPLVVAGRYRTHRYLIGPEVYPFYLVTLQWVLGVVLFVQIVLAAISGYAARAPLAFFGRIWEGIAPSLLGAFAIVTIVFVVIDRAGGGPGLAAAWSPRGLQPQRPGRIWETLFEMAFEAIFLLWWSGLVRFPEMPVETRDGMLVRLAENPIWDALHTPILIVVAASLATNLLKLLPRGWPWAIAAARTILALASVVIVLLLIQAGPFFETGPASVAEQLARPLAFWADRAFRVGLAVAAAIWVFEAGGDVWRAHRGRRVPA